MGSRTWIKIFCDSWFEGSIRQESPLVRSVFTDLLALAGRLGETGTISLPGGICGYTNEQIAAILNITVAEWLQAKDRLANRPEPSENRIQVCAGNIVKIMNWSRYQSEYERRRDRHRTSSTDMRSDTIAAPRRAVKRADTMSAQEREGEGEGEGEGEKKRSKSKASSDKSDPTSTPGPDPEPQDQPLPDSKGGRSGTQPQALADAWNEICINLPRVGVVSDKRVAKVKARLKQAPIDYWRTVFTKMNTTPFLNGENDRGWKATFDWVIKNDENADKVMSGAYGPPKVKYKVVSITEVDRNPRQEVQDAENL